jgi:hypothetical protein
MSEPHVRELSDQLDLGPNKEIFIMGWLHEPKGWFCRPEGSDAAPKPVMMWASCERVRMLELNPDSPPSSTADRCTLRNMNCKKRSFEIRPVIDLGGGVLGVAPYPVELMQNVVKR